MEAVLRARSLLNARSFSETPRPTRAWCVAGGDHSVTSFCGGVYAGGHREVGIGECS